MKTFKDRMEFRPLVSLAVILLICGILSGGSFFSLQIVDGHLYGRLIDILRNSSRYMELAAALLMAKRTAFGLAVEAIGIDSRSARLAGIKADRNI